MSWVKVDGGGWSWVEVGARFSNTQKKKISSFTLTVICFTCLHSINCTIVIRKLITYIFTLKHCANRNKIGVDKI